MRGGAVADLFGACVRSSATPPASVLCAMRLLDAFTTTGKPSRRARVGGIERRRDHALGDGEAGGRQQQLGLIFGERPLAMAEVLRRRQPRHRRCRRAPRRRRWPPRPRRRPGASSRPAIGAMPSADSSRRPSSGRHSGRVATTAARAPVSGGGVDHRLDRHQPAGGVDAGRGGCRGSAWRRRSRPPAPRRRSP